MAYHRFPWRNGVRSARAALSGMPSERSLRVIRGARANTVLVCGHSLADNTWLIGKLEAHGYRALRHRGLREVPVLFDRDPAAIALIEAAPPRQADTLQMVRRLDPRVRRRLLLVTRRPARGMVCQFIESGIGDFVTLPTPASELLLRVELRVRDARVLVFAERPEWRSALPEVNRLNGAIGPELNGIRLSDREFLLYDLLAQQFGTVVQRSEILRRIWGRRSAGVPSSNIVDVYVRYLRVKLAKVAPSLVITTARRVGYVLERRGE